MFYLDLFYRNGKVQENLLELSFDEIDAMKKKDLVSKIEELKGKLKFTITLKTFLIKYLTYQKISQNLWSRMKNLVASL